mmetsp:Transcript_5131/g.8362  ORF Transcript_5131/g.8362 Transcript_5131/m.8362 type:complete len:263 (-) Transcript_5131:1388-2176(-)
MCRWYPTWRFWHLLHANRRMFQAAFSMPGLTIIVNNIRVTFTPTFSWTSVPFIAVSSVALDFTRWARLAVNAFIATNERVTILSSTIIPNMIVKIVRAYSLAFWQNPFLLLHVSASFRSFFHVARALHHAFVLRPITWLFQTTIVITTSFAASTVKPIQALIFHFSFTRPGFVVVACAWSQHIHTGGSPNFGACEWTTFLEIWVRRLVTRVAGHRARTRLIWTALCTPSDLSILNGGSAACGGTEVQFRAAKADWMTRCTLC